MRIMTSFPVTIMSRPDVAVVMSKTSLDSHSRKICRTTVITMLHGNAAVHTTHIRPVDAIRALSVVLPILQLQMFLGGADACNKWKIN